MEKQKRKSIYLLEQKRLVDEFNLQDVGEKLISYHLLNRLNWMRMLELEKEKSNLFLQIY